MRKAAHLMVSNLAGSLALVTCKEPLRVSIGNHMRQLLSSATPALDAASVELVVQLCSAENLELGCMLIEKAATEKAMRDIDEALAPALQARRKHRETSGAPYFDAAQLQAQQAAAAAAAAAAGGSGAAAPASSRYPQALPDPLRPKPGGLQPVQLLVYEAFQRQPRQPPSRAATAAASANTAANAAAAGGGAGAGGAGAAQQQQQQRPGQQQQQGGGGMMLLKGGELSVEGALQAWQGAMGRLDGALQQVLSQVRLELILDYDCIGTTDAANQPYSVCCTRCTLVSNCPI
jgi:CCR4-NOT transcription complex subunit 1